MWLGFAIAGMLTIGCGDFAIAIAGRRTSRRIEIVSATWLQHATSLLVMALVALAIDQGSAVRSDYLWAVATGVAIGAAKPLLFSGLAYATISVFAPITAVVSIIVPVVYALVTGERPGPVALAGIALAIPAVVLVSRGESSTAPGTWAPRRAIPFAIAAGALFGASAITIGEMGANAGIAPVVFAYVIGGVFISATTLLARVPVLPSTRARPPALTAGLLDGTGFALVTLALQQGLVSVASALFALAPVVPVVLAWAILRERIAPLHAAAVALAFSAVVLMSVG